MTDLKKEFKFYIENQNELVKKFNGKFLVISGQEVVGDFKSHEDAFNFASSKFELGTFIIQHCLPGEEGYTQTFHSRVMLAV